MPTAFETVSKLLLQLNNDELERVRQQAKMLGASLPVNEGAHAAVGSPVGQETAFQMLRPSPDTIEAILLDAIVTVCNDLNLPSGGAAVLRKRQAYKSFAEKVPQIEQYLASSRLPRTQKMTFLRLAVRLLYENLIEFYSTPVGSMELMYNIHRIPEVVDRAFPSYGRLGLLRFAATRGGSYAAPKR